MTNAEIENRIARVNATMAMEGMQLTDDVKELLRQINKGKISEYEAKTIILKKYNITGSCQKTPLREI